MARKNVTKIFDAMTQQRDAGKPGDSVSTRGGVFYSYRLPIAHVAFNRVIRVIEHSPGDRSMTTAQHIGGVLSLCASEGFSVVRGLADTYAE